MLIAVFRKCSEIETELFQKDEGQNGVRPQPDEGRHVTLEESQRTLRGRESNQVHGTFEFSGLGVHGTSLENVQRLGHGGCYSALQREDLKESETHLSQNMEIKVNCGSLNTFTSPIPILTAKLLAEKDYFSTVFST